MSLIKEFYQKEKLYSDLNNHRKEINDEFCLTFDEIAEEEFKTLIRLSKEEKWDQYDTNVIKNKINSGKGPILDKIFIHSKCFQYYSLLRISIVRDLDIEKRNSYSAWVHNTLPGIINFIVIGCMAIVIPTGIIGVIGIGINIFKNMVSK